MRCNVKGMTVYRTVVPAIDKKPRIFVIVGHENGKMIITERYGNNHQWKVLLSSLKDLK